MPDERLESFSHLEFEVQVARRDKLYIARCYVAPGEVVERSAESLLEVRRAIKKALNPLSNEFVGYEGAINLFRRAFPGGFESAFFGSWERNYKEKARVFVAGHLERGVISRAIEAGDHATVSKDAKSAVNKTNLMSQYESMALTNFLKSEINRRSFAEHLLGLLYGDDFEVEFERFVAYLSPHDCAKWPIVTYYPFFRFPDQHMLLKPEITQTCAYRLGYDLDYDPKPNIRSYRSLLMLADVIRDGIASLGPKDNIDIQSLMYVVGKEGYVREAIEARKKFEADQDAGNGE